MTKKSKIVVCIIVIVSFLLGTVAGIFIDKTMLKNISSDKKAVSANNTDTFYENENFSFEITGMKIINAEAEEESVEEKETLLMIEYVFGNKMNKSIQPSRFINIKVFDNGLLVDNNPYNYGYYFSYFADEYAFEDSNLKERYIAKSASEVQSGSQMSGRMYYHLNDNFSDVLDLNINDFQSNEVYKIFKINTNELKRVKAIISLDNRTIKSIED